MRQSRTGLRLLAGVLCFSWAAVASGQTEHPKPDDHQVVQIMLDSRGSAFPDRWTQHILDNWKKEVSGLKSLSLNEEIIRTWTEGQDVAEESVRYVKLVGPPAITRKAQTWVRNILQQGERQLLIEMTLYQTDPDVKPELPKGTIFLNDEQLKLVSRTLGGGTVVSAPKLMVLNGNAASLTTNGKQVAYIRDYRITAVQDARIADPVVDVINSGITIGTTPVIALDGQSTTLQFKLDMQNLQLPFREATVELGGSASPVTIQLPELSTAGCSKVITFDGTSGTAIVGLDKSLKIQEDDGTLRRLFATIKISEVKRK